MARVDVLVATDPDAVARASAALDSGELIVFPADLGYVLAADALADDMLERLVVATRRGADEGLLVLVGGSEDIHHVAFGGPQVHALAERHWPGPAALALRPRPWLPDVVTAGAESVRVSAPKDAFAQALARHFGPIAVVGVGATPEEARRAVGAQARLLVDGGPRPGGDVELVAQQT